MHTLFCDTIEMCGFHGSSAQGTVQYHMQLLFIILFINYYLLSCFSHLTTKSDVKTDIGNGSMW